MKYIRTANFYILILTILGTLGVISYLLHMEELSFGEWLSSAFHYIWAILPFLLLLGLNFKKNPKFAQSIIIFFFLMLEVILSIIAYSLAIASGLHPKVSILLTVLPLYQLMLSIFAFPLYTMAGKHYS